MAIATGQHMKLATGGKTVVATGQAGTVVSWVAPDGTSGSYDESLIRPMQGDNPRYDTPRTKVGLY